MIISLTGYSGVGKDTVADYLVEHHGFTKVAYGDALKRELSRLFPSMYPTREELERLKREDGGVTRTALQELGEFGRGLDEDYWYDVVYSQVTYGRWKEGKRYVITDVRYENEALMKYEGDSFLIGIKRPGHGPVNEHVSETNQLLLYGMCDEIFENDNTPEELASSILAYCEAQL